MISFSHLNKKFGKLQVLQNINLGLESGRSYALIGPNGSGKTTLIKSLLGMVIPTSGVILFDGISICNQWKYREKIGYMPQIGRYPDNMSIGQLIDMMRNIRMEVTQTDEELIEAFQLKCMFDKRMHSLSGGTRQKVSAALAFLFNAPVLILDEPTAGLDPVAAEILKEKILREKQAGKLVIITSHILSDLEEMVTDVVYLFEGRIQYHNTIESLMEETGEKKLSKAVAQLINSNAIKKLVLV